MVGSHIGGKDTCAFVTGHLVGSVEIGRQNGGDHRRNVPSIAMTSGTKRKTTEGFCASVTSG